MGWKYSTPTIEHAYAQIGQIKALDTLCFKNIVHAQPISQNAAIRDRKLHQLVPDF